MNIREAKKEDLNQLVVLNMEVQNIHVNAEPSFFREVSENSLSNIVLESLNDEASTILVAKDEQIIVGYILIQKRVRAEFELMYERKCVYIEQVCVSNQYRNRGVFKTLLTKAKELTRDWGFNRLELDVWSTNSEAKKSFLKSGFAPYNEKMKIDL